MEKTFKNTEKEYVAPEMEEIVFISNSYLLDNTSGNTAGDFEEEEG